MHTTVLCPGHNTICHVALYTVMHWYMSTLNMHVGGHIHYHDNMIMDVPISVTRVTISTSPLSEHTTTSCQSIKLPNYKEHDIISISLDLVRSFFLFSVTFLLVSTIAQIQLTCKPPALTTRGTCLKEDSFLLFFVRLSFHSLYFFALEFWPL